MNPVYPIYVPSRDRYQQERRLTVRALIADDVPFRVVVPPSQGAEYTEVVGAERVLVLPEEDYVLVHTRNWIRDHAEAEGHARHWQLDDNMMCFYRFWYGRRIPCHAGVALRMAEVFTDRYENVGISGLAYDMFVPSKTATPYFQNCHVYSATLINHAMPYRWRGIYNDDTDLCLQALVGGWCTLLLNTFLAKKVTTMMVSGGNTDTLYRRGGDGDRDTHGRFEMARALERAWPGVVQLIRRFGRYQHYVDWRAFQEPLRTREGVDLAALPVADEHGLTLTAPREIKSERIREVYREYTEGEWEATEDEHWRGLPAFRRRPEPDRLVLTFRTEAEREEYVQRLGVTVDKRFKDKAWSAWWPPRDREDPASLKFMPGVPAEPSTAELLDEYLAEVTTPEDVEVDTITQERMGRLRETAATVLAAPPAAAPDGDQLSAFSDLNHLADVDDKDRLNAEGGWEAVPEFTQREAFPTIVLAFDDPEARDALADELGLEPDGAWKAQWPPPEPDPSAHLFDVATIPRVKVRREAERRAAPAVPAEWRGLPRFAPSPDRYSLTVVCGSDGERDALAKRLGVTIAKKTRGTWSAWYPPRPQEDLSSLRFESR